jgi:hypothetical protein
MNRYCFCFNSRNLLSQISMVTRFFVSLSVYRHFLVRQRSFSKIFVCTHSLAFGFAFGYWTILAESGQSIPLGSDFVPPTPMRAHQHSNVDDFVRSLTLIL